MSWTLSWPTNQEESQPIEEVTPGRKLAIHLDYLRRFSKINLTETVASLLNEDINLYISEDSFEMILTGAARANGVDFVPVWRQFCQRIRAEAEQLGSVTEVMTQVDIHTVLLPIPPGYRAALTKKLSERLSNLGHRYAINYLDLPNPDNCLVMLDLAVAAAGVSSIPELYSSPEDYINFMVKNQPGHVVKLLSSYDFSSHEAQFRAKYGFSSLMVVIWLFNQQQLHDASLYSYMVGVTGSATVACCDIILCLLQYTSRLNWALVTDLVDQCGVTGRVEIIQRLLKHALAANVGNPMTFLAVLQFISRDVELEMPPQPFFDNLVATLVGYTCAATDQTGSEVIPIDNQVFDLSDYFTRSHDHSVRFKNDLANGFYNLRYFTGSLASQVKPAAVQPNQSEAIISALDILQRHYQVDLAQIQPALD